MYSAKKQIGGGGGGGGLNSVLSIFHPSKTFNIYQLFVFSMPSWTSLYVIISSISMDICFSSTSISLLFRVPFLNCLFSYS